MVSTAFCLLDIRTIVPRDSHNSVSRYSLQFATMTIEQLRHVPLSDLLTLGQISPFALWFDGL